MPFKFTTHSDSTFILCLAVPQQDLWVNPITSSLWSTQCSPILRSARYKEHVLPIVTSESLSYVMQRIRKFGHTWWMLLSPWFDQTLYARGHTWAKINPIKTNSVTLAKLDLLISPARLHNLRGKETCDITWAFSFSALHCRLVTHSFSLSFSH